MNTVLELSGITKIFAGTPVLDNINLKFKSGELHALVGENGAGKSTMIKIISGVYHQESGKVFLNGNEVHFATPNAAQKAGISTLFQEIQEIPEMTVAENIFLGREPRFKNSLLVNSKQLRIEAQKLIERLGLNININSKMRDLPVSSRKMVEIARAMSQKASVVIMDEPTANLNAEEMAALFRMIDELKKSKTTIIYISHRMNEVFSLADRVSVLRDGELIATLNNDQYDEKSLITLMIGRELTDLYPEREHNIKKTVLEVKNLSLEGHFKNITFEVHKGEVLGLAGLDASGANAVTKTIFGLCGKPEGKVFLNGMELNIKNPAESISQGVAFLTEDRKTQGLFLNQNMVNNFTISALADVFSKRGLLKKKKERTDSERMVAKLRVKTAGLHTRLSELSGGNQQKVILGRWMLDQYKVLIMEEPTRGVDVGAKSEIYYHINKLAEAGLAVVMYSTEMPELLGMCDRILVFSGGELKAALSKEEATQERIMQHALVR